MSKASSRLVLQQSLVDLAWSLWTELGVSGWSRRHATWGIDPEPLILLTAALRDADPRLRDESTDWCIRNARFISAVRLRTFVRQAHDETRTAFAEYAATVSRHAQVNWPTEGMPRPYEPTGRSVLSSLDRPALWVIRLRGLFGTGTRAEIIRVLASAPGRPFSTAELANEVAFTTRAVDLELEPLVLAGAVRRTAAHGRRRVQVARPDLLLPFIGSQPAWLPRWAPLVRVLVGGLRLLDRIDSLPAVVKAVEAQAFLREYHHDIENAGLSGPGDSLVGAAIGEAVSAWLCSVAMALADGDASVFDTVSESSQVAR